MKDVLDLAPELVHVIEGFGSYPGVDDSVVVTAEQIGAGIESEVGVINSTSSQMMSNGFECFEKSNCTLGQLGTQCRNSTSGTRRPCLSDLRNSSSSS